ncbi:ferrous iron transporter B, partial [Vibrio parahaemolyticus]|nr:ferrous iron transporter B [Vibrio parahaemolyticus]
TLGCPVVSLSATNKTQVAEFKEKLHKSIVQGVPLKELSLHYGEKMESAIQTVSALFNDQNVAHRALAIRALEKDTMVLNSLSDIDRSKVLEVITTLDLDIDLHVADTKYTHLHEQCKKVRRSEGKLSRSVTERLDQFILNKWIGIPFFFVVMYLMFMFSINIGSAFIDFFDIGVGALLVDGGHHLLDGHLPVWLVTVLADGIGGGIQTVA